MGGAVELLLLTAIVGALWIGGARLWGGRRRSGRGGEVQLLRVCRGDAESAERLIAGEQSRAPGISRAEAASRAVERYRRDNR